jgi:hypothetical protein
MHSVFGTTHECYCARIVLFQEQRKSVDLSSSVVSCKMANTGKLVCIYIGIMGALGFQ